MSFGKLLAAGKSIAGGHDAARYKANPRIFLPKFGTPKNPFAQPPNKDEAVRTVSTATPANCLSHQAADSDARAAVPVRMETAAARVPVWKRVVGGCGEVIRKFNPLKLFKRRPTRASSAIPHFGKSAVQSEFPLERVRVVRNDLTDADIEVVSAGKRAGLKRGPQDGAWERLTARVFGTETT